MYKPFRHLRHGRIRSRFDKVVVPLNQLHWDSRQPGHEAAEAGWLLALTVAGKQPLQLPNGKQRVFLEDGDRIIMRGGAAHSRHPHIGFGEAGGTVLPACLA